jgi:Na+/proline symporter
VVEAVVILATSLAPIDWVFLIWFLAVSLGVGLYYARRAGRNLSEYFVSGRDLPWWALGTSMVATTFSADTPLAVTGYVTAGGIAKNWIWWSFLAGGTLTVFLFSRWWRRASITTEVELIAIRYDGAAARFLRGFKAVYLGLVLNSIVIGWVTVAMGQIVEAVFDVPKVVALGSLIALALVYTATSGLWGVVATDVLQFAMAMVGSILLAVLCVHQVGGLGALVERVAALEAEHQRQILPLFPTTWQDGFAASVLVLALVNWWAVYYPGAEPGGGGYVAQRMLAARDERHARAGTLWFIFAHYVMRPWPWILVGLCAMALRPEILAAPDLQKAGEQAYPAMFAYLPVGLLGLVVAAFFAAFLSTITTQLNLAASYLVNDLWLPFCARRPDDERSSVRVARLSVVLVTVVGSLVAWSMGSVGGGWTMLMDLTAGTGLVLILRWLWWRVNAWSEISAMLASAVAFALFRQSRVGDELVAALLGSTQHPLDASVRLLATVAFATAALVVVTLCTRPVRGEVLEAFYRRVRPAGWWAPVARAAGLGPAPWRRDLAMWIAATAFVLGSLFGIGSALLLRGGAALGYGALALTGGAALWYLLRTEPDCAATARGHRSGSAAG